MSIKSRGYFFEKVLLLLSWWSVFCEEKPPKKIKGLGAKVPSLNLIR
jgi:hypothetical protein